jgi:beta-1,4-N-acetylglucosaminyltransferase
MLTMLQTLSPKNYTPTYYIRAASDTRSEGMLKSTTITSTSKNNTPQAILTIPRSRSVGQSWLTTPFTTLYSLVASLALVFKYQPEIILCNGPGTCLPVCLAGYLLRFLAVKPTKIIFVESFCRVRSLSLTGKLLYFLADRFVVQWPGLLQKYPRAEYIGQLC